MTYKNSTHNDKNRIAYLDGLKAICIFLVVYAHTAFLPNESIIGNILTTLTWTAVPVFMMISGSLSCRLKEYDYKKYFKKLLKTYFVLCLWKAIYLLVGLLFKNVECGVMEYAQFIFLFLDLSGTNSAHTWYMVAYIVVLFLDPVINYLFNDKNGSNGRKILMGLALLCMFSGIILHDLDWWFGKFLNLLSISKLPIVGIEEILPFVNYANMIFYYILGMFLFTYKDKILNKIDAKKYRLFIVLTFSTLMLILIKYMETGSFAWNNVYVSIGYNRLSTIIMAICLYLIFYVYKDNLSKFNNIFGKTIGMNTLGIYYLHVIVIYLTKYLFNSLIISNVSVTFSIICAVMITFFSTIITIVAKKIPYIKNIFR